MLAFLPLPTMQVTTCIPGENRSNLSSYRKVVVMYWIWLFVAILLEVAATVFLKLSNGFSKLVPTLIMALLYGISFFPLAIALKKMDVSVAYAVWSAVGTALVTIMGMFLFHEKVSLVRVGGIALIILGVVALNLTERNTSSTSDQATAQLMKTKEAAR
jgi:small multidrug resistance pump